MEILAYRSSGLACSEHVEPHLSYVPVRATGLFRPLSRIKGAHEREGSLQFDFLELHRLAMIDGWDACDDGGGRCVHAFSFPMSVGVLGSNMSTARSPGQVFLSSIESLDCDVVTLRRRFEARDRSLEEQLAAKGIGRAEFDVGVCHHSRRQRGIVHQLGIAGGCVHPRDEVLVANEEQSIVDLVL